MDLHRTGCRGGVQSGAGGGDREGPHLEKQQAARIAVLDPPGSGGITMRSSGDGYARILPGSCPASPFAVDRPRVAAHSPNRLPSLLLR